MNIKNLIKNPSAIKRVLSNKWATVTNKTKRKIVTGSFVVALGLMTILGGCANNKTAAPVDPVGGAEQIVEQQETEDDQEDLEDLEDIDFASDDLDVENLDMNNDLDTQKEADEVTPSDGVTVGAVDEDGNFIDVPAEDVGQEIIEDVDIDDEGLYVAPDGSVWESEQDYQDYINSLGDNQETVDPEVPTDFNGYVAPDGSFWESEQDYQDYINSLNEDQNQDTTGTSEVTPEPGPASPIPEPPISDGSYKDPDGNYWDSEQDYLDYINSIQTQTGQGEDSYFVAPDGSYWDSEASYNDYINSISNEAVTEPPIVEIPPVIDEPATEEENYYTAPGGSVWASEQDYLDFIAGQDANVDTASYTAETEAAPVEEAPAATENVGTGSEDEYYYAPDGSVWASEQDYVEYMSQVSENEMTR